MDLTLYRISDNGDSTLGLLYVDEDFECYTLEDTQREEKISSNTAIPKGSYRIQPRKADTPLTQDYQSRFGFFDYHLELQGVKNFNYIYLHVGNYKMDTKGCILLGMGQQLTPERMVTHSVDAFRAFYNKVYGVAEKDNLTIEIK